MKGCEWFNHSFWSVNTVDSTRVDSTRQNVNTEKGGDFSFFFLCLKREHAESMSYFSKPKTMETSVFGMCFLFGRFFFYLFFFSWTCMQILKPQLCGCQARFLNIFRKKRVFRCLAINRWNLNQLPRRTGVGVFVCGVFLRCIFAAFLFATYFCEFYKKRANLVA